MGVGGEVVQAAVPPAFVVGELPVGGGQEPAVDEEVAQVDPGSPVGPGGQGLVGQRDGAVG